VRSKPGKLPYSNLSARVFWFLSSFFSLRRRILSCILLFSFMGGGAVSCCSGFMSCRISLSAGAMKMKVLAAINGKD